ncbi:glycine reductase [Alkaliphilus peptidifermentans DSM 18978]|uniref:Glycine reductase n=2 Tax=Alkaliphilus TaxID=114627 RepID=A0A1G5L295_9FIRM|nr:glycine reductase [Alkaliphilus peptidifermentans DSM 18978]
MKKAILYLNQFFGQIGGEELADHAPEIREGLVGPAMELDKQLGEDVKVTHTIICGDNFMGSKQDEAIKTILGFLEDKEFDIFFAGPAFRAGRYGSACGNICKAVKDKFGVPVISSMNDENPGVEMFKKEVYIFEGGASAAAMRKDVKAMATFGLKLINGEELLPAEEEGYFGRGVRAQVWLNPPVKATDRVIDMLLKKVHGQPFVSELPIPKADLVAIAPSLTPEELSKAEVAIVTSGGIVPVGNPDRIQSASATKWGKYDISQLDDLVKGEFMTIHAGFDPAAANSDSDVIVPLDALRAYEKEGKIGGVFKYFYSTVGTGTTQAEAARMGREIAAELVEAGVKAVILTST